ncbi:hypothetical protein [Lederbergia graminis]|uniref:Uncharacterized protein n=1 Tax=Lederbergia graminis TaxID=735518 RepID=A0ABW0LNW2_9BACI
MKPFIGLLKKEMLISRFWYCTWLVILLLGLTASTIIAFRIEEPTAIIPITTLFMPSHIFFMPVMIGALLRLEGKTQLWLYNPQSSMKLLLAKLTTAFIFQIISQLIVIAYTVLMTSFLSTRGVEINISITAITLTYLAMLAIALYFSIWVTFLWTLYHSLGRYPAWRNYRWLAVALTVISFNVFEALLIRFNIMKDHLFGWSTTMEAMISIRYDKGVGWSMDTLEISVPILPILLYGVLAILLFFAATKLLDKKVEV